VTVQWRTSGRATVVTIGNPPVNALGADVVAGLGAALDAFDASTSRVFVVTSGLDRFFAAGADIALMSGASGAEFRAYGDDLRAVLDRIAGNDRPSIAAVEGRALGGGLELALACSLRVGGADARLGLPEARIGLIPGAGGTQRLPWLVGRGRALEIMLSAREVPAEEAYRIGLLDRLAPAGSAEAEALALAAELAERSGPALTAILRSVDDAYGPGDGFAAEARRVTELFTDGEAAEGLRAFLDRRKPDFG
jgi:enoyl-CoA hydratase/carnithine racemase